MKHKLIPSTIFRITVIILILSLTGCKDLFTDPLKDKETGEDITLLLIDLNVVRTRLAIHLVDMATNEPISPGGEDIEILFLGDDAGNVITITGEKPDKFITTTDFLQVGYDPNLVVDQQNPLELTVVAQSTRYVSAPQFVSYSQEGIKDIIIKMIPLGSGKTTNPGAFNEPYDLVFNGILNSGQLAYIGDVSGSPTGTAWQYINLYKPAVSGSLICDNLREPVLYSDYGVYYLGLTTGNNLVPPALAAKNANLAAGDFLYSSILRSGMEKCANGLMISIESSDNQNGTAQFEYTITFSDGSNKTGLISATFPSGHLIEPVYFPSGNPAVTVELKENSQYDVTGMVSLPSPCGGEARFTATPKTNLSVYRFIIRYTCPNSLVGIAMSIGGQFRKSGSNGSWSSFNFVEGISNLLLETNADYDFRVSINGQYHDYSLPTDPETMEEFVLEHQNDDYRIRSLSISPSADLVIINAEVEFSSDVCKDLGIKK